MPTREEIDAQLLKRKQERLDRYAKEQEEKKYIKIKDLEDNFVYRVDARNAHYGIWIAAEQCFLVRRYKFGEFFIDEEYHWDCTIPRVIANNAGTVKPLEKIWEVPFDAEQLFNLQQYDRIEKYLTNINARVNKR